MKHAAKVLFLCGLVFALLQVWLPEYYLTADGPCHVYNAGILKDMALNSKSFFHRFFVLSHQPDPNWFSTALLAILLSFAKAATAEKIYLSLYLLCFAGGMMRLLLKLSKGDPLWLLSVFVLLFPHVLTKGFYNFSFGLAFFPWLIWSWLCVMEQKKRAKSMAQFMLFAALLFFSHLLAFSMAFVTCFLLVVSHAVSRENAITGNARWRTSVTLVLWLAVLTSPFLIMAVMFTAGAGGLQVSFRPHLYRAVELLQGKHLVAFSHSELPFTTLAASVICICTAITVLATRPFDVRRHDGLLWALLFSLAVYLLFPEDILGRAMDMSVRTQLVVYLLAICVLSYRSPSTRWKRVSSLILFAAFLALGVIHIRIQRSASEAQARLMQMLSQVPDGSIVLPLNFAPGGRQADGREVADWNYSFRHSTNYAGVDRAILFLDNYEANMGYFPIRWKNGFNPYLHLSVGYAGSFEALPPVADLAAYEQRTGALVGYVLMEWFDPSSLRDATFRKAYDEIMSLYEPVNNSVSGPFTLFVRKSERK